MQSILHATTPKKSVSLRLDRDLATRLKIRAAEEGRSQKEIVSALLTNYLNGGSGSIEVIQ